MASVIIFCEQSTKPVKTKLDRELLWYDGEAKKMHKFRGGKISFAYIYDPAFGKERLLPKVEDVEVNGTEVVSNSGEIREWFDEFTDEHKTAIDLVDQNDKEGWMEFDVPYNQLSLFTKFVTEQGYRYEVYNATS